MLLLIAVNKRGPNWVVNNKLYYSYLTVFFPEITHKMRPTVTFLVQSMIKCMEYQICLYHMQLYQFTAAVLQYCVKLSYDIYQMTIVLPRAIT